MSTYEVAQMLLAPHLAEPVTDELRSFVKTRVGLSLGDTRTVGEAFAFLVEQLGGNETDQLVVEWVGR